MLFYFSGTGNSRWVAETIADAIKEPLINIADYSDGNDDIETYLKSNERIGFCFPIHGWQPPRIVRNFIKRLNIITTGNHYCYAICTCGDNAGKAMNILAGELGKKGLVIHSAFSLIMPETYVCLPFMYTDTKEREHEKILKVSNKLLGITDIINERKASAYQITEGPVPWILTYIIGAFFNKFMITDAPFHTDAHVCKRCGVCKKVCPTKNIYYDTDGLPRWKSNGNCTCCLACYHHCPVHAINYGRITKTRGQYFFKIPK